MKYYLSNKTKQIVFTICFLTFTIVSQSSAKESDCEDKVKSAVQKYYPNYHITQLSELDSDLQQYLSTNFPGKPPGCIEEDFDGDGLLDYALLLRTNIQGKDIEKVVVLRGKKDKSFLAYNLDILKDRAGAFFIRLVPPGKIKKWEETEKSKMKTINLNRPGFELVLYESASRVYFWKSKKFLSIQTSD